MHAEVLHRVMHVRGSRVVAAHMLELGITLHSVMIGVGLGVITNDNEEVRKK